MAGDHLTVAQPHMDAVVRRFLLGQEVDTRAEPAALDHLDSCVGGSVVPALLPWYGANVAEAGVFQNEESSPETGIDPSS